METKNYTCSSCGKKFDAALDAPRVFCVYCGSEQKLNKIEESRNQDQGDFFSWLKEYAKIEKPEERLSFLEKSKDKGEAAEFFLKIWQDRFKKGKTKQVPWADSWLGHLQILITYKNEKMNRSQRKRIAKTYKDWFLTENLEQQLAGYLPEIDEKIDELSGATLDSSSPLYFLYVELLSLAYLYVSLCMSDKNYGSYLLGFGRRKESSIAARVSDDLIDLQLNVLKPLQGEFPLNRLLINALQDGYRMYFDENFALG